MHTLVSLRVAKVLDLLLELKCPCILETPKASENQVSILHLYEYQFSLQHKEVKHVVGVQCPFGSISSKPPSWIYHMTTLNDMPEICPQPKRVWYNDCEGSAVFVKHRPAAT